VTEDDAVRLPDRRTERELLARWRDTVRFDTPPPAGGLPPLGPDPDDDDGDVL
jgi:hypothetical protein